MAPGRALGEDTAALAVPRCPLLQLHVPLGACCPRGWLRALLHGGSGRPDQATAPVGPWLWLSQMGFIEDTCLVWSLFSFPFEERSHGRGVTERLSRLSWTWTVVPDELLPWFLLRLWRLQPKGQEEAKDLQLVCQQCANSVPATLHRSTTGSRWPLRAPLGCGNGENKESSLRCYHPGCPHGVGHLCKRQGGVQGLVLSCYNQP